MKEHPEVKAVYYAVCLSLYALILFWLYRVIKAPTSPGLWQRFSFTLAEFGFKGLTKSDVTGRRRRTRTLPKWQRFLYWVWFFTHFAIWFGVPIVLMLLNHVIQRRLFIPNSAIASSSNGGAMAVFALGTFFSSIALSVLFSSITNRGAIREADLHYRMGSFAEYPSQINKILSGICLLIGLPIMMLSLHSYTYFTDHEIVFQGVLTSKIVRYDEIENAEVTAEQQGDTCEIEYVIRYKDGAALDEKTICDKNIVGLDIWEVDGLLVRKQVNIRRIPIKPDQLQIMREEMSEWWVQQTIDMCGVSKQ